MSPGKNYERDYNAESDGPAYYPQGHSEAVLHEPFLNLFLIVLKPLFASSHLDSLSQGRTTGATTGCKILNISIKRSKQVVVQVAITSHLVHRADSS